MNNGDKKDKDQRYLKTTICLKEGKIRTEERDKDKTAQTMEDNKPIDQIPSIKKSQDQ